MKQSKVNLGGNKSSRYNPKEHPEVEKSLDRYLASGGKGVFHSFRQKEHSKGKALSKAKN